jgi:hypothetical protein
MIYAGTLSLYANSFLMLKQARPVAFAAIEPLQRLRFQRAASGCLATAPDVRVRSLSIN